MGAGHVDVLIVGAGLAGVGAACHLERECPGKSYAVLEAREAVGGTWDLFRYPGVRSDSDMFTLGYSFRPWTGAQAIADGESIRQYVVDTAEEHGVTGRIRFSHRVVSAEWSSADARWTVTALRTDTGETVVLTCSWLSVCTGYYRHDRGHSPVLPGAERFRGRIVHPQAWPADLDHTGARIAVVGSGATAVTLVPSLAAAAEHVTMVQRTPGYVVSLPAVDPVAVRLHRILPASLAYSVVRWKNVLATTASYQLSRRRPGLMKKLIRRDTVRRLPAGYDVDTHFTPPYDPWDQRLCLVPDGDLFAALRSGRASIVTGAIGTVTERGITMASGEQVDADVIVTATGLEVLAVGGMTIAVDGRHVDVGRTFTYKGFMLAGVPNLSMVIGYVNNSWTLKADLVSRHVCRLLRHLDAHGLASATPAGPADDDPGVPFLPLTSGYVQRSLTVLPRQGSRAPWRLHQDYLRDLVLLRLRRVDGPGLTFRPGPVAASRRPEVVPS